MKTVNKTIILICFLILICGNLFSDIGLIGSTANNFIKVLLPAKPASMGEAFVATADDINSIQYNPAGLSKIMLSEVSLSYINWFQQIQYENFALGIPFIFGNLAISLNLLQISSMDKTIVDNTVSSGYKQLYQFTPFGVYGIVSYAKEFTDNLFIGTNLKILDYAINPQDSSGAAFSFLIDLGFIYDLTFLDGLSAGIVFKNVGPSTQFIKESFTQPINIKGGIGYSKNFLSLEGDVEYMMDNNINYFLGASFTLFDILSLRGGYKGGTISQFTAGAGINYNRFSLDYAFVPYQYDDLGLTHRVTLNYQFGSPEVRTSLAPKVFSPNNDKYFDFTFLTPQIMAKDKATSVNVKVYDKNNFLIKQIPFASAKSRLYWNGYNNMNLVVPDGTYRTELEVSYKGGIKSVSNSEYVEVDNTPPTVSIDAEPKLLKPGQATALIVPVSFKPFVTDLHGIGKWKLVITEQSGTVFKTISGDGEPPPVIVWDGSDNTGINYVKTGTLYGYTFYASDSVGNWGKSQTSFVKVLLREIVINLAADTLFDIGKADVKISVYKDIEKVAKEIMKYKNATVIVEGHTDNVPVTKSIYSDNMHLSQARANAVVKFFHELFGLDEKMFTAIGKGETEPIASNDTPEGRQKNRRVTIRIRASQWE